MPKSVFNIPESLFTFLRNRRSPSPEIGVQDQPKYPQVPIPDPAEQKAIAECLSAHDTLIDAQVAKLETLRTHKQGLLLRFFPLLGGQ